MSDAPLAVTVALGAVPIVGAGIAGFFALANTVSRRIERVKSLAELSSNLPTYSQTTRPMIIRELQGIRVSTDPRCRFLKKMIVVSVVAYLAVFGLTFMPSLYNTSASSWITTIAALLFIASSYVISTRLDKRKLQLVVKEDEA
jgi:hypothetical protein